MSDLTTGFHRETPTAVNTNGFVPIYKAHPHDVKEEDVSIKSNLASLSRVGYSSDIK
jgi:hypothetical protein